MLLCCWGTMETRDRLGSMETSSQSIISLINKWPGTQLLIGPLWGEPLVTSGFHSQRASNMEIVSMTLCCHGSMETGGRLGSMETGSQSIVISLINDQELSNLLALCEGIHWSLVDSPHKWLVIWKLFPYVTELPWHYGDMWHYGNRRQGPVSLTFFDRYSNTMETSPCHNSLAGHQIATNFCTCHDSTAVVPCTKFCSDHGIRIEVGVKRNFHRIWIQLRWKNR